MLLGCGAGCRVLDLGANNGWLALRMLALGANVTAVEPQVDLAQALRESAELNCWADRLTVHSAYIETNRTASLEPRVIRGYRAGGRRPDLTYKPVAGMHLSDVLRRSGNEFKLIKMDADGPEGKWLRALEYFIASGWVKVESLLVECNNCAPGVLHRLQHVHGYAAFLLDSHIHFYHFVDWRGVDRLHGPGDDEGEPDFLQSLYSVRLMRHVYLFRPMNVLQWRHALKVLGTLANHYLLTRASLLEPAAPTERLRWSRDFLAVFPGGRGWLRAP